MTKVLVILELFLYSFVSIVSTKYEDFLSKINEYYDSYVVFTEEMPNYTLSIVEGKCNNTFSYGVFLSSYESGSYTIKIFVGEKEYQLPTDNRLDTVVYVVSVPSKETKVCVYDKVGNISTKRSEYTLASSFDEIDESLIVSYGQNLGYESETMTRTFSPKAILLVLMVVSGVVIISCLGIIIYMKKIKNNQEEITEKYNQEDIKEKEEKIKDASFDEDDSFIDINPLLEKKGFKTCYTSLTEEEKNEIMIYLMMLRHLGTISDAQYKKETSKLWKK